MQLLQKVKSLNPKRKQKNLRDRVLRELRILLIPHDSCVKKVSVLFP